MFYKNNNEDSPIVVNDKPSLFDWINSKRRASSKNENKNDKSSSKNKGRSKKSSFMFRFVIVLIVTFGVPFAITNLFSHFISADVNKAYEQATSRAENCDVNEVTGYILDSLSSVYNKEFKLVNAPEVYTDGTTYSTAKAWKVTDGNIIFDSEFDFRYNEKEFDYKSQVYDNYADFIWKQQAVDKVNNDLRTLNLPYTLHSLSYSLKNTKYAKMYNSFDEYFDRSFLTMDIDDTILVTTINKDKNEIQDDIYKLGYSSTWSKSAVDYYILNDINIVPKLTKESLKDRYKNGINAYIINNSFIYLFHIL